MKAWNTCAKPTSPTAPGCWTAGTSQAIRAFTGPDRAEFRRLLTPIWNADSPAALEALRASSLRRQRPREFAALFDYLWGHRQGLDAWRHLPAALRRGRGRTPPPVKAGWGAVGKNLAVQINRRCKRQGRGWNPHRAERRLQLKHLLARPSAWNAW
jgi:hypothetical protein